MITKEQIEIAESVIRDAALRKRGNGWVLRKLTDSGFSKKDIKWALQNCSIEQLDARLSAIEFYSCMQERVMQSNNDKILGIAVKCQENLDKLYRLNDDDINKAQKLFKIEISEIKEKGDSIENPLTQTELKLD